MTYQWKYISSSPKKTPDWRNLRGYELENVYCVGHKVYGMILGIYMIVVMSIYC